jgi:hypothetical protein
MNPRIPDTHAEAWALLPWLANGRIAPENREWVEAHVAGCADCRVELAAQRLVVSQVNHDESVSPQPAASEEQRSFNKLWARIEAAESINEVSTPVAGSAFKPARSARTVRWLAAAVVVQAIGLGVIGMALLGNSQTERFVTVSNVDVPRTHAPAVRVVFAPQASIATINTLLAHQGLSIVSGPGTSGNFTAELSADAVASGASAESVAAVISRDPNVTFAQPVAR